MPLTFNNIQNAKVSLGCPPPREGWKSFQFNLKNLLRRIIFLHYQSSHAMDMIGGWIFTLVETMKRTKDICLSTSFTRSEGSITAKYEVMIIDKFGKKKNVFEASFRFKGIGNGYGWKNFIKRSDILDESQNILDSDGTLTVVVSIKEDPNTIFAPNNPLLKTIQGMFLNVDTADVCFEVCSAEAKEGKKEAKASDLFHAHYFILKECAPMLVDLFDLDGSEGKIAIATIDDFKPAIFRHILYYVYGGSVLEEELKTHTKDIIDAADKYSIINLKLEAEAVYVKATDITMENAMDNLLYADAKNCALLKEAVMKFMADNSAEAYEKISFKDVPGYLMKDLLLAVSNNSKKETSVTTTDELSTLSVSALRSKLAEKGLDVDGSREAMIESIKNHS